MSDVLLGIGSPGAEEAALGDVDLDDLGVGDLGGPELVDVGLSVDSVRGVLATIGLTLHGFIGEDGAGDEHWQFSSDELDLLAPAVHRIAMRRPKLRQAIEHGDEMTVALILAGYFGRNLEATRMARKQDDHGDVDRQAPGAPTATGPPPRGDEGVFARFGGWGGGQSDGGRVDDDAPGARGQS
jgi:hypothetical protein